MSEGSGLRYGVQRGSETPMAGRCASPLAYRPGRYCLKEPVRGKTRCRLHGGASLAGIASPQWKTGMYSKVLAGAGPIADFYRQARANPALLQLAEQIALVDARVFELIARMNQGESLTAWDRVKDATDRLETAFLALREAQKTRDVAGMMASLTEIGEAKEALREASTKGESDLETWTAITQQLYLRKKLVDSESRRRKDAHDMVNKDQVLALMSALAQSVLRHVPDVRQRQAVVDDMRLLMSGNGGK